MQDICFWCKEERQRGKEAGRIIQSRAAGRQWDGVGRVERQQKKGQPWSSSRSPRTAGPGFMESDGEMCQGGRRRFDLRGD